MYPEDELEDEGQRMEILPVPRWFIIGLNGTMDGLADVLHTASQLLKEDELDRKGLYTTVLHAGAIVSTVSTLLSSAEGVEKGWAWGFENSPFPISGKSEKEPKD